MIRFFVAVVATFALIAAGLIAASEASAVGSCSNLGNPHTGFNQNSWSNSTEYEGVSANIAVRTGNPCVGVWNDYNFSNAYVMIANNPSFSFANNGWVQAGFITDQGGHPGSWDFAQAYSGCGIQTICSTPPGKVPQISISGPPVTLQTWFPGENIPNTNHNYKVAFDYNCPTTTTADTWCLDAIMGGNYELQSMFDPIQYWSTNEVASWSGEAGYYEAGVPGSSASKTTFSNMQAQSFAVDTWGPYPCGISRAINDHLSGQVSNNYLSSLNACNTFYIYDAK